MIDFSDEDVLDLRRMLSLSPDALIRRFEVRAADVRKASGTEDTTDDEIDKLMQRADLARLALQLRMTRERK